MSDISIQAIRLSKWYGAVTALQDVSLQLTSGIWGLLGPNGSGKTTFMRLVSGLAKPSVGTLRVCGESPFGNSRVLARIGLCPEADALYDDLSALEFVSVTAELSGFSVSDAKSMAHDALVEFGLKDALGRRMSGYSRGMRQRVKLAQSVVHEPDVLILDEPLTGTDPASRQVILDRVKARADRGALVLFSTHVLPEVEALTEQVLLISRGQLVAQGNIHEIRDLLHEHPHHVRIECERPRELAAALLAADPGILSLSFRGPHEVELETRDPDTTYTTTARLAISGTYHVQALTSPDATLEALFHYLVERSARGAGTGADAASGRAPYQQALAPGLAAPSAPNPPPNTSHL